MTDAKSSEIGCWRLPLLPKDWPAVLAFVLIMGGTGGLFPLGGGGKATVFVLAIEAWTADIIWVETVGLPSLFNTNPGGGVLPSTHPCETL